MAIMELNLLFGIFGMILLLAGLVLLLFGKIKEKSKPYLLLNILGGGFLFYYSYSLGSVPFMILQAVWTVIPLYKLIFYKR
jgi:hypothetical protein